MTMKQLTDKTLTWVKVALFLVALIPLARLIIGGLTDALGANPIEKITRSTGYWTLVLIMVTLAVTPLRKLTGWHWLTRTRRMLGLFAFFYACLHFLTYLVLDQFFDWDSILKDIIKRPYITVGFPTFLLLIPLAVTSNNALIKKLGGKRWKALHRLIYVIGVGGVVHYWWLVKKDLTNPITFAAILAVLLGFRLVFWWRGRQPQVRAVIAKPSN
ncbi:sulfoxide reductase heme-binding subunit YedZ [Methylovulum psychrotolerans]|uniref:Protein-methionine-sulfoxide reductase heme-binding subunit MsrQ n=2 Tax=Methylovulum psychrotolerans TaxID=1704499 RepID=A0A1Z4BZJ5_9GAMM|nr:sulfoxide reductase heme-binding subunit YedZ [Methylovulum psychrotolerans]